MLESLIPVTWAAFPKRCWRVTSRRTPCWNQFLIHKVSYDFHSLHCLLNAFDSFNRLNIFSFQVPTPNEQSLDYVWWSICIENEELIDLNVSFAAVSVACFTAKLPRAVAIPNKIKKIMKVLNFFLRHMPKHFVGYSSIFPSLLSLVFHLLIPTLHHSQSLLAGLWVTTMTHFPPFMCRHFKISIILPRFLHQGYRLVHPLQNNWCLWNKCSRNRNPLLLPTW